MRINDILVETQSNEDFASGLGDFTRGVASVPGAIHGVWDAAKRGYQQGRAAVGGVSPDQQKIQKATTLRQQADAIDGGNSAQFFATPHQGVPGFKPPKIKVKPQAAGGQGQPYVAPTIPNAPPANAQSTPINTLAPVATPASTTQPTPSQVRQSKQAQASQTINPSSTAPAATTPAAPNTGGAGAFSNMANTVAGPNTMANTPVSAKNVSNKLQTPAPKVRQAVPNSTNPPNIKGLPIRNMKEGKVRSSFLDMDI